VGTKVPVTDFSSLKSRSPRFMEPGAGGRQRQLPLLKSSYFMVGTKMQPAGCSRPMLTARLQNCAKMQPAPMH